VRTVGHRQSEPCIDAQGSSDAFKRGLAIVDAAATFGWATSTGQGKGVYRFKSFDAMEQHRIECLAAAMAERAARADR
jgi:hypothetical protein